MLFLIITFSSVIHSCGKGFRKHFMVIAVQFADPGGRVVEGVGLRPLTCGDSNPAGAWMSVL
jgi:hypothetical protein